MEDKNTNLINEETASQIKRNTFLIVGNSLIISCFTQLILVVAPLIASEITGTWALAGLSTSIIFSGDIATNYHAGKLADSIGRKKTLLIGIATGLVGLFLMMMSKFLLVDLLFWIGILILGLSTGFLVINRVAIMDMYPQKRGQSLGYLNTGSFVGSLLAPAVSTVLASLAIFTGITYYDSSIIACLALLAFGGVLILFMKIDTKSIAECLDNNNDDQFAVEIENNKKISSWVSGKYTKRDLSLAFIISALSVGGISIAYAVVPIILYHLEIEMSWITFTFTLISFGTGGLSIVLGKLADKIGRKKVILSGATIMGIGLFILTLEQNYIVISATCFFSGLGAGAIAIGSTSLICDMTPVINRGKVFGTNSIVINIVTFALPTLATSMLSSNGFFSISILGLVIAAIVVISTITISKN